MAKPKRDADNGNAEKRRPPKKKSGSTETFKTVVYALLIALFIRTFIVQAFRIPSGSMEDTLLVGDFLLVDKLTYGAKIPGTKSRLPGFRGPRRGDILVFKDPRTSRDFIKRCVATGGETIDIRDNEVFIDGRPLTEPYKVLKPNPLPSRKNYGPKHLPAETLFMMGDNRNNSQDSRYWNELALDRVVGRAFVLYWSTDPHRAPGWVRNMDETWVKGFFQLFLGRPRITRFGNWLAKNYTDTYEAAWSEDAAVAAPSVDASASGEFVTDTVVAATRTASPPTDK